MRAIDQEGHFNSPEFAELENLREIVEQEQKAVRDRLSKIDARNRHFFEKAAAQIDSDAGARKLLKMVRGSTVLFCDAALADAVASHHLPAGLQFAARYRVHRIWPSKNT